MDQSYLLLTAKMLSKLSNWKKEVDLLGPLFHESEQVPLGGGLLLSVERVNYLPRQKENIFIESSASA